MSEELELYKKKYELLLMKVSRMRYWQKQFLKYFIGNDKLMMQKHQREVDKLIEEEIKLLRTQQKAIEFNN